MSATKKEFLKRGVDYPVVDGARTLPGKYYHSREIYDEEVEKIFSMLCELVVILSCCIWNPR